MVNKVDLIKNLYACVMPTDKKRKSAMYDMKTGKKEKEFDIVEEYEVYLVNNSDYPIEKVEMLVGGFASQDDEGLLETSKNYKDLGRLDSKQALLLENLDFGMLDFMNWYYLDLYIKDAECLKLSFQFKYLQEKFFQEIPVLNKKGYNIEFDMRDTEVIKDEVKNLDMDSKFTKTSSDKDEKFSKFLSKEILTQERNVFIGSILSILVGYVGITLWLNAIRATAPIGLVWVLIIVQLILYFSIFNVSYQRSKVLGLKHFGLPIFIILAVLGRVENWEQLILPLLIGIMIVFSLRNKNVSSKGQSLLEGKS